MMLRSILPLAGSLVVALALLIPFSEVNAQHWSTGSQFGASSGFGSPAMDNSRFWYPSNNNACSPAPLLQHQTFQAYPTPSVTGWGGAPIPQSAYQPVFQPNQRAVQTGTNSFDVMDVRNFSLLDYRRMFINGTTPTSAELAGNWRGVNKGIVELVGYRQFIKEIKPQCCELTGDNIMVEQVSSDMLRSVGWQVKADPSSIDGLERKGKFAVEAPRGIGAFKHGTIFSYRNGANKKSDPVRLLVDKVVKLDDNHLLGRATANFGPIQIPLAYFVLERISH